jgi:hypothetical protein
MRNPCASRGLITPDLGKTVKQAFVRKAGLNKKIRKSVSTCRNRFPVANSWLRPLACHSLHESSIRRNKSIDNPRKGCKNIWLSLGTRCLALRLPPRC